MHDPWTPRLSEYIDGELAQPERDALEHHLQTCAGCSDLIRDLRRVSERARSLSDAAPSRDLWAGIAARRPAPQPRGFFPRLVMPDFSNIRFSLPQLVAAAITVAVISGAAVWLGLRVFSGVPVTRHAPVPVQIAVARTAEVPTTVAQQPAPAAVRKIPGYRPAPTPAASDTSLADLRLATARYEAAIAELERALRRHGNNLDPRTRQVLAANLRTLDRASTQAKLALASDPTDTYLYGHLDMTLRRKMQLLRRATNISANSQI